MSQEQLAALIARLKEDSILRHNLSTAADLESAVAIAREAGFDVGISDWNHDPSEFGSILTDAELEGVAGGKNDQKTIVSCDKYCPRPAPAA